MPTFTLTPDELTRLAQSEGFDLAGITGIPESDEQEPAGYPKYYLEQWIAAGHAGEMEYLKRRNDQGALLRAGVQHALPWARSVIVCAVSYNALGPLSTDPAPADTGWIARYAWAGRRNPESDDLEPTDYHDTLLTRLRSFESSLHQELGDAFESRSYVDTGPLLERDLARRAGIGWIGKNTCTLHQRLGSWLFLGCIATSLEVAAGSRSTPAADRCGTCRRCIEACPTEALIAPRQMDASRCISYLTIEKRGSIPEELRAPMGRQIFGCDICQDVCPWNRKAAASARQPLGETREELVNAGLAQLAALTPEQFNKRFRGSPVKRTKRSGFLRNVAIAMGNSGELAFAPQLASWAESDEPVLADAAVWALARLRPES